MKYCRSCGIYFQVPLKKCLFCNNETEEEQVPEKLQFCDNGEQAAARYVPVLKENVIKRKLYKLLCFVLMIAAGFCLYYDITEDEEHYISWSIIMIASGTYVILFLRILADRLLKSKKVIYIILLTACELVTIGASIRDMGWTIDFIIPFAIIACMTFSTILLLFSGKRRIYDYAIYVVNLSLLGFLPFFFLIFGLTTVSWPSVAAALQCLITLLGLIFFSGGRFFEELKRRVHL